MFKYLKIFSKQFSKRQQYVSIFEKFKIKDKYNVSPQTPANDIKVEKLNYQTSKSVFDNTKKTIHEDINVEEIGNEGLFLEVTKGLKEEIINQEIQQKSTNFAYLLSRFGIGIGETKEGFAEDINKLNYEHEFLPRLNKLTDIGLSNKQIKVLLHKE
jgi:hypothetical protein